MTERKAEHKLTLAQWDAATTEQRSAWLKQGYYLSMEDANVLRERKEDAQAMREEFAAPMKDGATGGRIAYPCDVCGEDIFPRVRTREMGNRCLTHAVGTKPIPPGIIENARGRRAIGYCRDCRVPVYSQTVSVDHQANGCRIQYDERPGVPAPLPVAECLTCKPAFDGQPVLADASCRYWNHVVRPAGGKTRGYCYSCGILGAPRFYYDASKCRAAGHDVRPVEVKP